MLTRLSFLLQEAFERFAVEEEWLSAWLYGNESFSDPVKNGSLGDVKNQGNLGDSICLVYGDFPVLVVFHGSL